VSEKGEGKGANRLARKWADLILIRSLIHSKTSVGQNVCRVHCNPAVLCAPHPNPRQTQLAPYIKTRQTHRLGYEESAEEVPHAVDQVATHAGQAGVGGEVDAHEAEEAEVDQSELIDGKEVCKLLCTSTGGVKCWWWWCGWGQMLVLVGGGDIRSLLCRGRVILEEVGAQLANLRGGGSRLWESLIPCLPRSYAPMSNPCTFLIMMEV